MNFDGDVKVVGVYSNLLYINDLETLCDIVLIPDKPGTNPSAFAE